uniref:Uncharacterized protein n=1 Tax=Oryza punctata TaxID=4537 RepID=A0A0E0LZE6_ORYPU
PPPVFSPTPSIPPLPPPFPISSSSIDHPLIPKPVTPLTLAPSPNPNLVPATAGRLPPPTIAPPRISPASRPDPLVPAILHHVAIKSSSITRHPVPVTPLRSHAASQPSACFIISIRAGPRPHLQGHQSAEGDLFAAFYIRRVRRFHQVFASYVSLGSS